MSGRSSGVFYHAELVRREPNCEYQGLPWQIYNDLKKQGEISTCETTVHIYIERCK